MTDKTLFLAWQDKQTRAWFPIGRLDVYSGQPHYRFRYTHGAEKARREASLRPLFDFPDWGRAYESSELFPLFQNRVISPFRTDFHDYLRMLDLPDSAEPAEILEVGGGNRVTDNFEVFPRLQRNADGSFRCRFFVHGSRHSNPSAIQRMDSLAPGENLYITIELTNPVTQPAVQIQTTDYHVIGWAPRYLVKDLVHAMAYAPAGYRAHVVRVNPQPAPSKQRLLVELSGSWPDYEPMTTEEFVPLVQ